MPLVFAGGAGVGIALALWLGHFPEDHWIHQSRPLWVVFVTVAVTITVLLVLVG